MIENKDICTIVCDDGQYNCCGQEFHIGDYVCWSATPFSKSGYRNFKIISVDNIDYSYEDCADGIGDIVGKVIKITLLRKNENGFYEEVEEYSSGKELSENPIFGYMLITLEDSTYREYNDEYSRFNHEKCVIAGNVNEIEIAKEFKKLNFDIKLIDIDNENVLNTNKELRKIKSFSKAECYSIDLEDKEQLENFTKYSEYKIWIIISNEKIYENVINRYSNGYKDCDIYHINHDKQIIENYKIISKWKYYTFDELIKMSPEEKACLFEIENNKFNIKNMSNNKIAKFLILKVINKNLF